MSESFRIGYFNANAPDYDDNGPVQSVNFVNPFAGEREPGDDAPAAQVSDDESRSSREIINRFVDLLIERYKDTDSTGRTVLLLAYQLRRPKAPAKSIRQLADEFGVSSARAFELLTTFRRNISDLQAELHEAP